MIQKERIILAGHGSPKADANNVGTVADLLHDALHPGCRDSCVRVAYLQFVRPDIAAAIDACVSEGAERVIIHPYFLYSGMHVTKDIPGIIASARTTYPSVDFIYTEPLGIHENLVRVIVERIRSATFLAAEDIEKRSFEIISDETDLGDIPEERKPIVQRVIHATADFEFKTSLRFHPDAVRTGVEAIRAGKDILTDVEMVRTGISKRLITRWGGTVRCGLNSGDIPAASSDKAGVSPIKACRDIPAAPSVKAGSSAHACARGVSPIEACRDIPAPGTGENTVKTRAESGIERMLSEKNNIGIIAIGNAPTALLKTIEILKTLPEGTPKPLVIGVPVGFVKALESKALLASQGFPFITNLSRKGGTPVAVAIVNALLGMADQT